MFFSIACFAQSNVKGTVKDTAGKPVEFAEVNLVATGVASQSTLTDIDGSFSIRVKSADYILTISMIGKVLLTKNIVVSGDVNLGDILVETAQTLGEVVLEHRKKLIEKKPDRLVFNIENADAAIGTDALEALKLVPRVQVVNDAISIVGKGSVMIMIDDRPLQLSGEALATYLRSLRSDDIKSVEVITNPPSRYSAEGNSGILNIKLKKARRDVWNGSVQSVYGQNHRPSLFNGGNFNYQKGSFTLQSNVGYNAGGSRPNEYTRMEYPDKYWNENSIMEKRYNNLNGRLGIDYKINDKLTTGLLYYGMDNINRTQDSNISTVSTLPGFVLDSIVDTDRRSRNTPRYQSLNYHIIFKPDTLGTRIAFDADYFNYAGRSRNSYRANTYGADGSLLPESFSSKNNRGIRDVDNFSGNLDIEHPLKWLKLNYGGRVAHTKTRNDFEQYDLSTGVPILDEGQTNSFKFTETTVAAFADASKEFGKFSAKLGLRMESTRTHGVSLTTTESNVIQYTRFFPTAYVMYNITDDNNISLNYGKRIRRPDFEMLNPFRTILSPYSYSDGNPYLKPSYSHNVELEYNHGDLYNGSVYFSTEKGYFENLTYIDPETAIQRTHPTNFINSETIGTSHNVMLEPFKWYRLQLSADVYYADARSTIPVTLQHLAGWNASFRCNQDFFFNDKKTYALSLRFNYVSKGVDGLDVNSEKYRLDASFKMLFLDKKLQLLMYGNDILRTSQMSYTGYSNGVRNQYMNYSDLRYFRLSLVYNFGGDVKIEQRDNSKSEEQNRL
jgi:hypothetical protein